MKQFKVAFYHLALSIFASRAFQHLIQVCRFYLNRQICNADFDHLFFNLKYKP